MKALVYTGVETLDYADAPRPRPGEGEDLIRIHASGICGSDMHAYLGHDDRRPAPLVLGHEAAGIVLGGPDDGRRVTIFSGGAAKGNEEVLEEIRGIRDGGGFGSIMGRNAFQRDRAGALELLAQVIKIYQGKL